MRFFFFFLLVTLFNIYAEKADAMNIQCSFYHYDLGYEYKKGCDVRSVTLSSSEDREITSVNGNFGKTYIDVWWFTSESKTLNHFPGNIKKFFPNVEAVRIDIANITTLTKSDMASLGPQLRRFDFYGNKIEVLEEGLFDENPNLEEINLHSNKIKFVASGVFDKLPKLTSLNFSNNTCHFGGFNDRAGVLNLIKHIESNCQNISSTTTTTTTEKVKTEYELKIEELIAEILVLKRQQFSKDFQHQVETIRKDAQIVMLEEQNEVLKQEVAAIKPCDELYESTTNMMF